MCLSAMCMFCSVCITAHFSLSYSFFAHLHFFLIYCTILWHCLLSLLYQLENFMSSTFLICFLSLGMLLFVNVPRASIKVFHFELLTLSKFLYFTISAYIWPTIRKRQLKLLRHIMKKRVLENLTLTVPTEGNRNR